MSATRYSTAFAHVVSAGASLWAFRGVGISNFSVGSFGIFLLNSAIGIVTFGELKPPYPFYMQVSSIVCYSIQKSVDYYLNFFIKLVDMMALIPSITEIMTYYK